MPRLCRLRQVRFTCDSAITACGISRGINKKMKIIVDLQGAQTSSSKTRGVGRYSVALSKAMAAEAHEHELWIALNGLFPETIEGVRAVFDGVIPQDRIVVWQAAGPVAEAHRDNNLRLKVAER